MGDYGVEVCTGLNFRAGPGPAHSHYGPAQPGSLINVICKARPVQAHSLAGLVRPGRFLHHYNDCMHYANLNRAYIYTCFYFLLACV